MLEYSKIMKQAEEAPKPEKVDPIIVDRWESDEVLGDEDNEDDHDKWHKLYQGTARDKLAHQDMHKQQFNEAKAKRDKACNNKASAEAER